MNAFLRRPIFAVIAICLVCTGLLVAWDRVRRLSDARSDALGHLEGNARANRIFLRV